MFLRLPFRHGNSKNTVILSFATLTTQISAVAAAAKLASSPAAAALISGLVETIQIEPANQKRNQRTMNFLFGSGLEIILLLAAKEARRGGGRGEEEWETEKKLKSYTQSASSSLNRILSSTAFQSL